ncbi:hypothetical protein [Rhabdothermincola salaria]|uniref:hypothetical protein n=1 Tax=Rhabdothermincola salaria TaxID=2903142 RepID=UPI001E2C6E97|nr:hypothetical protein [Rhabdothermincola salaria]MCD9625632.1 hypothetical protein [Rhabdothermincola salaria]
MGELSADVDAGLAGIIEGIWRLGIPTRACCEGGITAAAGATRENRAYISFDTAEQLERFLDLFDATRLSEHRWQKFDWSDGPGSTVVELEPIGWRYDISVRRPIPGIRGMQVGGSVRIPVGDLAEIESVLVTMLAERDAAPPERALL